MWAFQYLRAHDAVDPERVGVGGICTGASMVTVAAQDERIRDHVKFVNFFAGYYDAADFAKAIGSRSRFSDDYVVPWRRTRSPTTSSATNFSTASPTRMTASSSTASS